MLNTPYYIIGVEKQATRRGGTGSSKARSRQFLPFELPAPFVVAKNDGRKSIIMDCFFWLFAFFLFILHIENRSDYFIFRNKQIIS